MTIVGLVGMSAGLLALTVAPWRFGIAGYVAAIVVVTACYAAFQAANNTTVMTDVRPDQRGVISGMLGLSRHLGLITGASLMGTFFTFASRRPISRRQILRPWPQVCERPSLLRRF